MTREATRSGITNRLEGDEERPVRMVVHGHGRDLERKPGLAGAARTGQGHKTVVIQVAEDRGRLLLAAHERGELGREVVRPRVHGRERRKAVTQARSRELEEPLGLAQVTQAMDAQVDEPEVLREVARCQAAQRFRDEHLAAVRDARDPRGPVDGQANQAPARGAGRPRVQAHAHTNHCFFGPRF